MSIGMTREAVIETARLELHHIAANELISLFETPEDIWIVEGKSFTHPHRELLDNSGPLAWPVPQVNRRFQFPKFQET